MYWVVLENMRVFEKFNPLLSITKKMLGNYSILKVIRIIEIRYNVGSIFKLDFPYEAKKAQKKPRQRNNEKHKCCI